MIIGYGFNNFIPRVPYFSNHPQSRPATCEQFVTTYIKCSTKPFVPISIKVFHYCDRHNMVALNQNHLSLMARAVLIVKTIIWLRQIQKLRAKVCSKIKRFWWIDSIIFTSSFETAQHSKKFASFFWVFFHNTIIAIPLSRGSTQFQVVRAIVAPITFAVHNCPNGTVFQKTGLLLYSISLLREERSNLVHYIVSLRQKSTSVKIH